MDKGNSWAFLKNKRFQLAATAIIFLIILLMSSSIRLSNWDLLTDSTTGEKIPMALDPFYFLRIAETIVDQGSLPEVDSLRAPGFDVAWSPEIMPRVVVGMWKVANIFGDYSLQTINVFSPVFFYAIGLILFFFLVYVLTKSKAAALIASSFLAFTPAFLYRTMAGFSDHEAIGILAFFAAMLGYVLVFRFLEGLKEKKLIASGIMGLIVGALTTFTAVSWGGITIILFLIIPLSFALFWIIRMKNGIDDFKDNGLAFYSSWIISSVIFTIPFGVSVSSFIGRYMTKSTGIVSLAVLGFIILDRLLISFGKRFKNYNEKHRSLYSLSAVTVLGILALPLIGRNFFSIIWDILNRLLDPSWGGGRVGATVAENAQLYLGSWASNSGAVLFWLFVGGMILIGIEFSKNIKSFKNRSLLTLGFVGMIFGILFSRISPSSVLNGEGLFSLSGLVYLGGLSFLAYAFLKNYLEAKMNVSSSIVILAAWMFVMLVVGRTTARLFFVIIPFMCLVAAYFIITMYRYWREKELGDISKAIVIGILIISVLAGSLSIYTSSGEISNQAKVTGPSAHMQWQNAMAWVRENTEEDALFSHWWDYGYWVQTLGKRATVADGGHAQAVYDGNHKIGRYVLTTPNPATALSFFKTMDVDYLLIDPTDLGKYPAYSRIGGGDGINELDRYSVVPVMLADPRQTVETSEGVVIVFSGGSYIYEDIVYSNGETDIFLPAGKAAIVGIVITLEGNGLKQPEAVYTYNNVQTRIPIRYAYYKGEIIDFRTGLDAIIDIIPTFDDRSINQFGAAIYLSQKVSKSAFARLYLMDDVFEEYKTIKLVHSEDDSVVSALRNQGGSIGDFVYYRGFRGPIKIWDVQEIPEEIRVVPEFKEGFGGVFGALDDLEFTS